MTAAEYELEFKKIKMKRGREPQSWWIGANHKENIKSLFIKQVAEDYPDDYKRELTYQKELKKITVKRLKCALPFEVGQKAKIYNRQELSNRC